MLWAVAEEVFFGRVSVEIEIELYASQSSLLHIVTELTQSSDLRKHILIQPVELPIKILPTITSPKIASNDAIRVQHRHHIENKHRSQNLRLFGILQQLADEALQYVGRVGLARMNAAGY